MAFLTTGEFYTVDFFPSSDASWAALGSMPDIPSAVMDAIVNGSTLLVYVIDSGTGNFAFVGGSALGFDDSVLDTVSGALTKITFNPTGFSTMIWAGDGTNSPVVMYNSATGVLYDCDPAEVAAFKAWIVP